MPRSDVPFGSEFGPNQVDLAEVLRLAQANAGDGRALTRAVAATYRWPEETAKNTRLGLRAYKLIDESDRLTSMGEQLLSMSADPGALHEEFARHILLHLRGMEVVTAIEDMRRAGERITLETISAYLKQLGIYVPATGTHLSKMQNWLAKAGIFSQTGNFSTVDIARARALLGGTTEEQMDAISEMPEDQQAFVKVLASLPMPQLPDQTPILASDVVDQAKMLYGTTFNEKGLVKATLNPLEQAGLIVLGKAPKATGTGAGTRTQVSGKSTRVYRTERFRNQFLIPLVSSLAGTALPVRRLLRLPLSQILDEMDSHDRNVKGKALEALAFYFMRLLDLEFREWRLRGRQSGGAEVDVLVEGARLIFTRWQIQCKNTERVDLRDVAEEVGLSLFLKSNVILIITTGRLARDAEKYAKAMMESTNLNIITIDKHDLSVLRGTPLAIARVLDNKARLAMEIKSLG